MTISFHVYGMVKRVWWYVCTFLLIFAPTAAFSANDKVYTVAKFKVEATDKNAVRAKNKAIAAGRIEAFYYLLRRVTSYSAYSRLPRVDANTIKGLVDSVTVRDSKNSRVKYIASLDFNFRANEIRKLLRSYAIPFLEEQSSKVSVLPIYLSTERDRKTARIQRSWRKAWLAQDIQHILTPVQIGHLKAVASPEAVQSVLSGDRRVFEQISNEYQTSYKVKHFVMAIAHPSQKEGKMSVSLVGNDGAGPIFLQREYNFDSRKGRWDAGKAADYSLRVMEGRWKIVRSEDLGNDAIASAPESVLVTVIFSGFREWQKIRTKISKVPGIDSLEVGSLSARGAEVSLSYPGGAERLQSHLARYQLNLQNENGAWILRGL